MRKQAPLRAAWLIALCACSSPASHAEPPAALNGVSTAQPDLPPKESTEHTDAPIAPPDSPGDSAEPHGDKAQPAEQGPSPATPITPPVTPPGNPAGEVGSETGNPPKISFDLVITSDVDDGVQVAGEPGAVAPGGATVEVTNLDDGEVVTVQANADGSFTVMLTGATPKGVSIRVSNEHGSSMPMVLSVERAANVGMTTSAMDAGTPPAHSMDSDAAIPLCPNPPCLSVERAPLACDDRQMQADNMLDAALTNADLTCTTATDCVTLTLSTQCHTRCSAATVVNRSAQPALDALLSQLDRTLCGGDYANRCSKLSDMCPEGPAPSAACEAGHCTLAR
jgi:hypothetical protein